MDLLSRFKIGRKIEKLKSARALTDEERHEVEEAVVAAGDHALRPLLRCLSHAEARGPAMELLERLLDDTRLDVYLEALASPNPAIVTGITKILAAHEGYDASRLLDSLLDPAIPKYALETILLERAEAIPPRRILESISGASRDARNVLIRVLDRSVDTSVLADLLPWFESEDWWVRLQTARLLSRFANQKVVDGMIGLLEDENRRVRLEAVNGLRRLKARGAVPELCKKLRDSDLKVQSAVIDALIELGDAGTVPQLLELLTDESEQARRGAVEVLNEVATTVAIQDLLRALHDEDWWVRVRAADALGALGGERVVEAVIGLLDDDDEFIRRYAVEILNSIPHEKAVAPLISALQDRDWWVRERSIDALGNIGDPQAVEPLLELLECDPKAVPLCVRALGKIGDVRALETLCRLVQSPREDVQREVAEALSEMSRRELSAEDKALVRRALGKVQSLALDLPSNVGSTAAAPPVGQTRALPRSQSPSMLQPVVGGAATGSRISPPGTPGIAGPLNFAELAEGTLILDRYEILRKIGSGGFGAVYLVLDAAIQEEVILKILNPQLSVDEKEHQRFIQELKLTRKVTDRNVIRIFDLLDLGGVHAVSMEYFPGRDLGKILAAEGTLEPARALQMVLQICHGLGAAHDEGVIHRDIKPPNVLVGVNDTIKIVDFGLAWAQQRAGSRLTKSGILIGTPEYMAPELIRDEEVDHRIDIYSLGVMMYEMLSGKQPFVADSAVKILFRHLEGGATPLQSLVPGIPDAVQAIVDRTMAVNPDDRPSDVRELAAEIEACLATLDPPEANVHG